MSYIKNLGKQIKFSIELSKTCFNAQIKAARGDFLFLQPIETVEDYNVFQSEEIVKSNKYFFSMVDINDNIVVDNDFMKLSDNAKKFLLYHEVGHIAHKHLKSYSKEKKGKIQKERKRCIKNNTVHYWEKEADEFVMNNIPGIDCISALNEMKDYIKNRTGITDKEIENRIKNLNK